ncbi:MAG: acetylornithine deacetylase [Desulfitibacter sp. BRH_c19]|nr:MAG: acetylornithine deacetylase [Desulfitibacter sp. BRH_c19]
MSLWLQKINSVFSTDELVELTQELIRRPSHWEIPEREKDVLEYICSFLERHNIPYEKQPVKENLYNIIVTIKGEGNGKRLLLNGHVDTVPPYEMDFNPFSGEIIDGHILGRGAVDMKGPVAAMLMTMLVLNRLPLKLKGDVTFTAVIGEEGCSEGTEKLVLSGIEADGAIVGEPSNFDYAVAHRGLEWFEIEFFGRRAHSGDMERGINAINMACRLVTALEDRLLPKLKERFHPLMGPSMLNIGKIEGGTQPSTVAEYCKIQLDRRYINTEKIEDVTREIEEIITELKQAVPGLDIRLILMECGKMEHLNHVPMITDENESIVQTVINNVKLVTKRNPACTTRRGWTDAGLLNFYRNIPTIICGCGDISFSHSKNEQISIEQLIQAVQIYTLTAIDFCNQNR